MSPPVAPVPEDTLADSLHRLLIEGNPMHWLREYGWIVLKNKKLVKIQPNPLQEKLGEITEYMLNHGLPVRILIYKPRQKGSSTGSMGWKDWFMKRFGHNGYLVGNQLDNCDNLWKILKTYNENDGYDWGFTTEVLAKSASYGNGATGKWATAKNAESGRSATIGALVMTEIARWAEGENGAVRDAGKVFSSLLGGVPKEANTLVIAESTVRGASGVFYEQWQQAKTFEQLKAGDYEWGDFIKIFMPWYVFADSFIPCKDAMEEQGIHDGTTALNDEERKRELEWLTKYKLKAGHIKYMRMRLRECDYDPEERDREEPTTVESGFYSSQPCFFNKNSLRMLDGEAMLDMKNLSRGILEWDDEKLRREVAWSTISEEERPPWMLLDRPLVGLRYIIGVDNCRGIAVEDGKDDTDNHAAVVLRDGYFDKESGEWRPPRVVAVLRPKYRLDVDVFAEELAKMSKFFGGCMVVPEANNDGGLIKFLRDLQVPIYERKKPATEKEDQKPTGKFGVWTSDNGDGNGMRSEFLGNLRRAVRRLDYEGEGIQIPFAHVLDEMTHFAINLKNGKAEALPGHHDDFVMALAFAYHLRSLGTVMSRPVRETQLPRELQRFVEIEKRLRAGVARGAHRI